MKRARNDPHNPNSTAYRKDRHEFAEALTLYAALGEDSRTKALEFMRGLLLSEHARNGQIDGDGMTDGIEGARARVAEVTRGALAGYDPEEQRELAGLISYAMHEDAGAHALRIAAMAQMCADVAGM